MTNHVDIFSRYFKENTWGCDESFSGAGSTVQATKYLVRELDDLLRRYSVKSILDLPCGDFNWMRYVDLAGIDYLGADCVEELIALNRNNHPERNFVKLDLLNDTLPTVDLIICRDCLFHFPNDDIEKALSNIKRSGSKFILTTSFSWKTYPNIDISMGDFRRINLEIEPFNLPPPYERIIEGNQETSTSAGSQADRAMCLWPCSLLKV